MEPQEQKRLNELRAWEQKRQNELRARAAERAAQNGDEQSKLHELSQLTKKEASLECWRLFILMTVIMGIESLILILVWAFEWRWKVFCGLYALGAFVWVVLGAQVLGIEF